MVFADIAKMSIREISKLQNSEKFLVWNFKNFFNAQSTSKETSSDTYNGLYKESCESFKKLRIWQSYYFIDLLNLLSWHGL